MPVLRSFYPSSKTKKIVKTDDWHIHYDDGTNELDLLSGGLSFICGQSNSDIVSGLEQKLLTVARAQSNKGHETDETIRAGEILTQGVWHSYSWALSGTNAVESAISMNDEYWHYLGEDKPYIISFPFTWHGSSYLTKSFCVPDLQDHPANRVIPVTDKSKLESVINDKVGCIIFETSTFVNNIRPHSEDWWRRVRKICDDNNILMITDDVASCWGRCKAYHPYQTIGYGIQPDISAVGKSLAGGYVPFGAAVCNEKVGQVISQEGRWKYPGTWQPSMAGIYLMLNTYDYMEKHDLIRKSFDIEQQLIQLGTTLISDDVIENYRTNGTYFAFDVKQKTEYSGYSSTKAPNTIKGCAPLIADNTYFKELEQRIR